MKKQLYSSLLISAIGFAPHVYANQSVDDKIEALQLEIDQLKVQSQKSSGGINSLVNNTTIGGYGSINYNSYKGGASAAAKDKVDVNRFVLYFGHKFNDMVSLKSELEIEHAISSAGDSGEVEVEQLYLDFHFNDQFNGKVGLFLMPLGLINETHEPTTFYGVERNEVETRIIPTTWREAGIGAYGEVVPGFAYQFNVTTNFSASKFDKADPGFRSMHQEGQLASAENLAISGALNYLGTPGLKLGVAFMTGDAGQNTASIGNARLTLWDIHGRYSVGDLDLRALYARGHLADADKINTFVGDTGTPSSIYGWYTEAAYHVWKSGDMDFAPFIRYEKYDGQSSLPSNGLRIDGSKNSIVTLGGNFWVHPGVVLKADYQTFKNKDFDSGGNSLGDKRINLGMGYMF